MDNKLRTMRTQHMRCGNAIFKVIRRSFLLAGLCILTDVAIGLLVKITHKSFPEAIFAPLAMYDINLIVNLLCISATFRDCKIMLFPCLYTCTRRHKSIRPIETSFRQSCRYRRASENNDTPKANFRHRIGIEMQQFKAGCETARNKHASSKKSYPADRMFTQKLVNEVVVVSVDDDCSYKFLSERANTNSAVFAERNRDIDSEPIHHFDSALQLPKHQGRHQKRSASLNLSSHISMPIIRRAKSHIIFSLLSKSKSWLLDQKH